MKQKFIDFGNLVGTLEFFDDEDYDNCIGMVRLMNRVNGEAVTLEVWGFGNPRERDVAVRGAFEAAAAVMGGTY